MKFGHIAQRLFNVPLAIHPLKAEVAVAALAERLGITHIARDSGDVVVMRPGMFEDDDYDDFTSRGREDRRGYDVVGGVAIIQVEGMLVQKNGYLRPYSGMTGYDGIRQNFLQAMTDNAVRAIVLDIDSPGGEVSGCFDLVDTIYSMRDRKPVASILNECAYSAAYAIASAAGRVYVPRTGGTGSIGVISMHVDWSEAIKKQGMAVTLITFGSHKADGNQYQALPEEVRDRFQADINTMGELFVSTVARNRNLSAENVRATQAATFLGEHGLSIGLADSVMAPDAAFRDFLSTLA